MATRTVREYGDEILTKKSREVESVDDKIKELVDDMIETLHKYNGVGLAAPQVGVLKRVVVIDIYEEDIPVFVLINPEIIEQDGEQEVEEGCLSFPYQYAKIKRPKRVKIKAIDRDGNKITLEGKDLLAQAIAHEIDHLNGELFIKKIIPGTLEYVPPKEEDKKTGENN